MNKTLLILTALALTGCKSLEPVDGAPEVHTGAPTRTASVTIMADGSRFVVISRGEAADTTILLPPVKPVVVEKPR